MWVQTALAWSNKAKFIQTSAEGVTEQVDTTMDAALANLINIESDAGYSPHPLSKDAAALSSLRNDLDNLLNQGQVITASPYQVGNEQNSGHYLNPQTAVEILTAKLRDQVDKNRPTSTLYCIAIMVSESQLTQFATMLTNLTTVLTFPDWCQAARQSTALSTNSVDKFYQPGAIAQPRFKPQANLNAEPLRELLKQQGSQIATLESLANDTKNVIGKLQLLAAKRVNKLEEISLKINGLKTLSNSVYSISLTGSTESIATQLKQATLPNNNQHTIMSLLLSPQPLTFFEELLCSA